MESNERPAPAEYCQVVRFRRDAAAKRVYTQIQEAIRNAECDLSVYNVRFNGDPTVVVLGDTPPSALVEQLQKALAAGTPAALPAAVITMLTQRSIEARAQTPWAEGHYGAGQRII